MDFFTTHISPYTFKLVKKVLKSNWLSEGEMVRQFESELEKQLCIINPVAVNSGTSALHLSLVVVGIKPGDEVIIPAQTFIATGYAVLMQNAKPVFADIQYSTGNIEPDSIEAKITEKTKAIIPVHWGGYPCDMDEINILAKKYNLKVIDDAAHAIGAVYKNKPVGTLSDFTAFSFQAIKHLTTGDGGLICCSSREDYKELRKKRWFNIDKELDRANILGERQYNSEELGYKYHMNNISAAIGLGNLYDLKKSLERRRKIAKVYNAELKEIIGLKLPDYKSDRISSYWLYPVLVEKRNDFIKKLKEIGIPTSVVHQRIDRNSVFGGINEDLTNQSRYDEEQINIPVHEALTDDDIYKIITTIKSGW